MQLWKMPVYGIMIAYGRARLVCTKASASAGKEERLSSDGLRKKVTKGNKEEGERAGEAKQSTLVR
jgi:hypothetical protein